MRNPSWIALGALALFAGARAMSQDVSYSPSAPIDLSGYMTTASANATIADMQARQPQLLNDVTLAQSATISISAGPRQLTVATNCLPGDRMVMSPSEAAPPPAGYMLGDIRCTAAGTAVASLYAPLLAIGAGYSITARVTAFR